MNRIVIDNEKKCFLINVQTSSYAFAVNKKGVLINLHWGGRVEHIDDLPNVGTLLAYRSRKEERSMLLRQEYPAWGGEFYGEPALKINYADGTRGVVLKYVNAFKEHFDNGEQLVVTLKDEFYPLELKLLYRVFKNSNIIERHAEINNLGNQHLTLESVMSGAWHFPRIDDDYRLSHLAGRWAAEGTINRIPVKQNKIVLESRTGLSGPFAMPFFALDHGNSTEFAGDVWFGSIQWSGNWKLTVNRDAYNEVSVVGGINDFDFSYPLHPKESFSTPVFCAGFSREGFGGASRMMHDYQRHYVLPESAAKPMPLLVNTWASLHADVDEASVIAVIDKAAEIGAELFVIDDGWQSALGDWRPDPAKFPNGLAPVIERAKNYGMDFGLWVEIESFEKRSKLYEEHPEWVMRFKNRHAPSKYREFLDRTSFLINFAREDVLEYFFSELSRLIEQTEISYMKLDMNYFFTDPGWDDAPPDRCKTIWYQYAKNILQLFERLNKSYPHVRFENCASGGGRSDLAMSRYFGRINRSDNQDPLDILKLHEGFTWMHMPGLAGGACHISDDMFHINHRQTPLEFQAIAGMLGSLAIGKNLPNCSEDEIAAIKKWGDLYKRFRHITYYGDLYRLTSIYEKPYAIFEYVSKDCNEALLFVFSQSFQFGKRLPAIRMKGLAPDNIYSIKTYGAEGIGITQESKIPAENRYYKRSGQSLMEIGIQSDMLGDYRARVLHFKCTSIRSGR